MNQNQQDIDESLLLQYLIGNVDEELSSRVEDWLNADVGNRAILDLQESVWLKTGKISPPPVAVDVDAAWGRISRRMEGVRVAEDNGTFIRKTRNLLGSRYFWAAAASVLLIVGIFTISNRLQTHGDRTLASQNTILTDSLPDGTKVILNRNSSLTFPEEFSENMRGVKLSGEAIFAVKPDKDKPFIVDAGLAKIRVLGTLFRVSTHPDGVGGPRQGGGTPSGSVEVSVTEGRVMLFRIDEQTQDTLSLILLAGESGEVKEGSRAPERTDDVCPDELFWANRSLDFSRTPLSEVFGLLEKYYQVRIEVSDLSIGDCRLTASFVDEPPERILSVIAESFGLKLEVSGKHYQISGNGCGKAGK